MYCCLKKQNGCPSPFFHDAKDFDAWCSPALQAASSIRSSQLCIDLLHQDHAPFSLFFWCEQKLENIKSMSQLMFLLLSWQNFFFFVDLGHLYIWDFCYPVFYMVFVLFEFDLLKKKNWCVHLELFLSLFFSSCNPPDNPLPTWFFFSLFCVDQPFTISFRPLHALSFVFLNPVALDSWEFSHNLERGQEIVAFNTISPGSSLATVLWLVLHLSLRIIFNPLYATIWVWMHRHKVCAFYLISFPFRFQLYGCTGNIWQLRAKDRIGATAGTYIAVVAMARSFNPGCPSANWTATLQQQARLQ